MSFCEAKAAIRPAVLVLSCFWLASCDDASVGSKTSQSEHKIVAANGYTFLLNSREGSVYVLKEQEFVEIPRREPKAAPAEQDVKELSSSIKDLDITTKLKFLDEKLLFFVQINPQETVEYKKYTADQFDRLVAAIHKAQKAAEAKTDNNSEVDPDTDNTSEKPADLPPLIEPKKRYINSDWQEYWKRKDNFIRAHFEDADGFPVATIDVSFSGNALRQTQIVDDDEEAIGYSYYGEVPLTLPNFQRIETLSVTWRLDTLK